MQRADDYSDRRKHLAELSEDQLKERFWRLTAQVVEPLLEMAKHNTSPSIERAVLLRMGFSSLEAMAIVEKCVEQQLLGKGAGHIVWRTAQEQGIDVLQAGRALAEGRYWTEASGWFRGGAKGD